MAEATTIIGAGIGGLASAIRLAARGHKVTISNRTRPWAGKWARCGLAVTAGTRALLITMRHVFDDLFAAANRRLATT